MSRAGAKTPKNSDTKAEPPVCSKPGAKSPSSIAGAFQRRVAKRYNKKILSSLQYSDCFGNAYMKISKHNRSVSRKSNIENLISKIRSSKSTPFLSRRPTTTTKKTPRSRVSPHDNPGSCRRPGFRRQNSVFDPTPTHIFAQTLQNDLDSPHNIKLLSKDTKALRGKLHSRLSNIKDIKALRVKLHTRLSNIKDIKSLKHYAIETDLNISSATLLSNDKSTLKKISIACNTILITPKLQNPHNTLTPCLFSQHSSTLSEDINLNLDLYEKINTAAFAIEKK
ncbi:hypothetical protein BB561_005507 [Smittium simulii]|uniref:Uncharacterized protein n=1 Tax=Smittium simulii TaxID=133385 RepID=A0A2T9YA19_9FUNG|nr:hypothetical protein BB561_005507 [Smittium simulii]